MSTAGEQARATRAMDIEAQAAAWLRRRHFWNWSQIDQAELDDWLDAAMAHRIAYWRLNAALARTERLAALRPTLEAAPPPERRLAPAIVKIAAAIAVIAVIGAAGAMVMSQPKERVFSTPVGGHEMISFADGSRIELNTDTILRTRMTTDRRDVWLDRGEAYFQVKHDPAHPFVVTAGNGRITDLGTKFLVCRDARNLEVALVEGSVRFGTAEGKTSAHSELLKPGDEITDAAGAVSMTKQSQQELENELSWRRGVLVFKYTPLAEAAAQFNRYNRKKLVIADPAVAQLTVYGTIPTNDVDGFIRVARSVLGLRVADRGNEIVISR